MTGGALDVDDGGGNRAKWTDGGHGSEETCILINWNSHFSSVTNQSSTTVDSSSHIPPQRALLYPHLRPHAPCSPSQGLMDLYMDP